MRRIHFLFIASAFVLTPSLVVAEAVVDGSEARTTDTVVQDAGVQQGTLSEAAGEAEGELAWGQFDDPDFDPTVEASQDDSGHSTMAAEDITTESGNAGGVSDHAGVQLIGSPEFEASNGVRLGPVGVDELGRRGRLHTVASGDTLWDLSAAYLGTPWVWPSVWIDNGDIENPHLIMPGNKIWITANEMRVVTDEQAESFLETAVQDKAVATEEAIAFADETDQSGVADFASVENEEIFSPVAALEVDADDPSTLEAFPVAVAGQEPRTTLSGQRVTISQRDAMGFVSTDDLAGASTILDSSTERTFLAEGDQVVLGMGEGDLEVGDQFTIFRVVEEVRDVDTNRILGHHVDILGWVEVRKLTGDTSLAEIRTSYAEMRRGVRVMPRAKLSRHVTTRSTPDAIEGRIVFLPGEQTVMADGGYVYLNRGEFHGVEIGSELEVYEAGRIVTERSRRVDVKTPDRSIARLVVVSVTAETSVAFILTSSRELEVGDDVRPRLERLAQR